MNAKKNIRRKHYHFHFYTCQLWNPSFIKLQIPGSVQREENCETV